MKILNTISSFSDDARLILEKLGEVTYLTPTQDKLVETLRDFDVALIGLGLRFDREILSASPQLKVIATATTGLDHIDTTYADQRGIKVLSLRGEDAFLDTITSTAELAFGLMVSLMRQIVPASESVKTYVWARERFRGHSLSGRTLGIVGMGRLGRMMSRYGLAFGMKVVATDPAVDIRGLGANPVDFLTLIKESDVISIHVHLAPETENLFDRGVFRQMKPSAYLINTSRGKIVNEADLLEALRTKKIAGYATDVLAGQLNFDKVFENYPLVEYARTHDNCLIVPHLGGMTFESRKMTDLFITQKLRNYL